MRKSIKKVAATLMAATMVLGTMSMAFADDPVEFTAADCENDAVHYTIPGGINNWNPKDTANELTATAWEGVYSKTVNFPAFDPEAEWNSRFKVTKIDELSVDGNGWAFQLALGTTTFDDNQSAIRVECEEALENATIYFDANTGAVVILDANGSDVDYKFSWVGADNEVQYTTVSEFANAGITWPSDKVKADEPKDIAEKHEALYKKVTDRDLADESLYEDGNYNYTVAGGSVARPWAPASSANQMKPSTLEGVLEYKMSFPAFSEDAEYLNRFKICRLDDITCSNGWLGSLCLGTTTYDDNQTTFRVENAEPIDATIYFYPETGAVVIKDQDGNNVDYKFSWVGYDNEVQYTTVSEFANAGIVWPEDKVKTEVPADLADTQAALAAALAAGAWPNDQQAEPGEQPGEQQPAEQQPAEQQPAEQQPAAQQPAAQQPAANNNPTTAAKQAAKTGDVAPVAILFTLVAAVAVVTVAAKKKEA